LRSEEVGVYVRNRLEHGTDKRDRGVRTGKGEEDERKKEKREMDEDEDIIKKEERQEAKACSIGWRSCVEGKVRAACMPWHGRCPTVLFYLFIYI